MAAIRTSRESRIPQFPGSPGGGSGRPCVPGTLFCPIEQLRNGGRGGGPITMVGDFLNLLQMLP